MAIDTGTDDLERQLLLDEMERQRRQNTTIAAPPLERPVVAGGSDTFREDGGGRQAPRSVMDILKGYDYGAEGLLKAEKDLGEIGALVQKDSSGRARGRIKEANGDIVDVFDPREGRTAENNWVTNPITGGAWNYNNLGQEGLDAGGWSFGGPSAAGPSPSMGSADSSMLKALAPTDMSTYSALQDRLLQILGGQGVTDRDVLLRMLGAQE